MPLAKFGIVEPDLSNLNDEQLHFVHLIKQLASSSVVQQTKNPMDPRTWPISTYISLLGMIGVTLIWAFNSGGNWRELDRRVAAVEVRQQQDSSIYARRDLLEQQMSYVVTGLNELKVKVDQLTANSR